MGCFFSSSGGSSSKVIINPTYPSSGNFELAPNTEAKIHKQTGLREFTFAQLMAATDGFRAVNLLSEGGFGKDFKGRIEELDQTLVIKRLDRDEGQGIDEFAFERWLFGMADHPNLVKLVGYCAEGEERLLVYEYMPLGSLADHLHGRGPNTKRLDWNTRMNIATDVARGLAYLHDQMNEPIVYCDLRSSNILLDEDFHAKLSDFGLAKVGPVGSNTHFASTRGFGAYDYRDPVYALCGQLTPKSDIYSFGVVLLELITGRKAIDLTKCPDHVLVSWARPLFKDSRNFPKMVDPVLEGEYPQGALLQAMSIAFMCLKFERHERPPISDIVTALNNLDS